MLARILLLSTDDSTFPSYPHGQMNYVFMGFVAAVLGALSPAALLTADYTAGVFLGIGLGQFHTVRQIERTMLISLEDAQLVPRGKAYIEGLAMMLETRNYLAMVAALVATTVGLLFGTLGGAVAGVLVSLGLMYLARLGRSVGSVCRVATAAVRHAHDAIWVGDTAVWWSPPDTALAALPQAIGLLIQPRDLAARLTIGTPGQRQAILHDISAHLGVAWAHPDHPGSHGNHSPTSSDRTTAASKLHHLLPRSAVDARDGTVAVLAFPEAVHAHIAVHVARGTPLLETLTHRWMRHQPAVTAPPRGSGPGGSDPQGVTDP